MAVIVSHVPSNKDYVLIGTGFGAFQSKKPNWLLGDLMADTSQGQYAMVCVADKSGRVRWIESQQVVVKSVDGTPVGDLLS